MKTLNINSFLMSMVLILLGSESAWSEKMSLETQDLVIQKMERTLSLLEPGDRALIPSQQRLADLLAERARARFMLEIEANCQNCKGSKADRDQAVKLYESLLKTVNLKGDGRILFQLAHLYQMGGNTAKAQQLFEGVLKSKGTSKTIITRAHAGLADLLFQKGQFVDARKNYIAALNDKDLQNKSLLIYNKAWCEFNSDQLNTAIGTLLTLLSNPQQITRDTEDGSVYDKAFHIDLMKDLATFYSRRNVSDKDIATYEKLIPVDQRKELLMHFAQEVDRVGQKRAAGLILNKYLEDKNLSREERLQAFIMKAQVNYDNGQSAQSVQDFAKAAQEFKSSGCDTPEQCDKLKKTMKYYVTELHRSKKLKPDSDLIASYGIYTKAFPEDKDMHLRGAQTAIEIGSYVTAISFYRNISKGSFSDKEKEEALLSEVTTAERSGKPEIKKDSYVFFLKNSSNETKKFEVRYQLAYLAYQQKQLKEAALAFNELAADSKGSPELRKKSADLSLDALAQLKNDETLEQYAWQYAILFPKQKSEYETLARKALMNQVAMVANNPKSSQSDLRKYLDRTLDGKLASATTQEKIHFYSNASVLASKLNDQAIFLKIQLTLLEQPGLPEAKKQEAYANLAAYYEKHLDFKKAYDWALKIKNPKVSESERQFRLGTLADLSNQSPEKHYRSALNAGLKDARSVVIRTRLIALAKNPISELKKHEAQLKRHPQMLNDMVLYVYAKTGNQKALQSLLNSKELRNRSASRFILGQALQQKIMVQKRKMSSAKLNIKSPKALNRGTLERVKMLASLDSLLKESLKQNDLTAQMMTLELISKENDRLVQELSSVPQPKGLTPAQQAQYHQLLENQLKPYTQKAQLAESKKQEIWSSSAALSRMITEYNSARPEIQKLMNSQLRPLAQVSGSGSLKSRLDDALSTSYSKKDLVQARQSVSEDPTNRREIENLKTLETKMGHPLMPSYLDARLSTLQKENRL